MWAFTTTCHEYNEASTDSLKRGWNQEKQKMRWPMMIHTVEREREKKKKLLLQWEGQWWTHSSNDSPPEDDQWWYNNKEERHKCSWRPQSHGQKWTMSLISKTENQLRTTLSLSCSILASFSKYFNSLWTFQELKSWAFSSQRTYLPCKPKAEILIQIPITNLQNSPSNQIKSKFQ